MAKHFLIEVACLFVISLNHYTEPTRFLPMVVWDHLNPLLNCKCNWLNIPKIDVFDEFDFVCPTPDINAILLDGITRQKDNMNANIYKRKWNGTKLEDLESDLSQNDICNPSQSEKVAICRNGGDDGVAFTLKLLPENNYKEGDIYIFFNNVANGKAGSLNSADVKCEMVFVANITFKLKVNHDMTYGKCFNPGKPACSNISSPCVSQCNPPAPCQPSTTPTTHASTTPTTRASSSGTEPVTLYCPTTEQTLTCPRTSCNKTIMIQDNATSTANCASRLVSTGFSSKNFGYGIVVGIIIGVIIIIFIYALVYITKAKKRRAPCSEECHEETAASQKIHVPPKEPPNDYDNVQGFNNKQFVMRPPSAFQEDPVTPEVKCNEDPVTPEVKCNGGEMPVVLNTTQHNKLPPINNHHNRLPSIEMSGKNEMVFANFTCNLPKLNQDKINNTEKAHKTPDKVNSVCCQTSLTFPPSFDLAKLVGGRKHSKTKTSK